MPEGYTVSAAQVEALAGKLDALGDALTDDERAVLLLAFRLVGDRLAVDPDPDAEVEGFQLGQPQMVMRSAGLLPSLADGFRNSYSSQRAAGFGSTRAEVVWDSGVTVMGTSSSGRAGGAQY